VHSEELESLQEHLLDEDEDELQSQSLVLSDSHLLSFFDEEDELFVQYLQGILFYFRKIKKFRFFPSSMT